jgi:hypothetical protein
MRRFVQYWVAHGNLQKHASPRNRLYPIPPHRYITMYNLEEKARLKILKQVQTKGIKGSRIG